MTGYETQPIGVQLMTRKVIKIEPIENRTTNIVEWMMGNTCNFDCSLCSPGFKSGDRRFFDVETYKTIIDKLVAESAGKKIWFKLTGGEPTLFPGLIEVIKYIRSTGNYTHLITNGSRTLRYWKELKEANCVDYIAFTYHPEQTSELEKMVEVVNLFQDVPTSVAVNVTCPQHKFVEALLAFNYLKKKCVSYINLQQINDGDGMTEYTEVQQDILLAHSFTQSFNIQKKAPVTIPEEHHYHSGKIKYMYDDGSEQVDLAINFIKRKEDNFFGYECQAGMTNIRIDYDTIQRAVCGLGERWSIFSDNLFKKDPIICSQTSCSCTLDMMLPKTYK